MARSRCGWQCPRLQRDVRLPRGDTVRKRGIQHATRGAISVSPPAYLACSQSHHLEGNEGAALARLVGQPHTTHACEGQMWAPCKWHPPSPVNSCTSWTTRVHRVAAGSAGAVEVSSRGYVSFSKEKNSVDRSILTTDRVRHHKHTTDMNT
jgi:hypothetical protein